MSNIFHNVRIEKLDDSPMNWYSRVFIDDCHVSNIKSLDFHVGVDEVPECTIECFGFPNIDGEYAVNFEFTPQTIEEAIKLLESQGYEVKHNEQN